MQRRPSNASKELPEQETPSKHHQCQEMLARHQQLLVEYGEAFNTLNISVRDHTAVIEKLQKRNNYTVACCVVSLVVAVFTIFKRK